MKSQSYDKFWQRIHQAANHKGFPLRVMFELTYKCNFFCQHCYVPLIFREKSKKNELNTKEIFFILNQLKDIGCFYLGFTGGEPFMRKDIMEILWYAKTKGFEIIIYTNGSLINEKIANQLKLLRPNKVDVTIPAMSKDAFESISGVSNSRDKVFKAIDLLHKNGVNLGFKTCVLKENESEICKIQDFAASLGAIHRLDDMLLPCLNGSKEPFKHRGKITDSRTQRPEDEGQKSIVRKNREFIECNIESENRIPNTSNLFKCGVGVSQAAITPLGELKMCLMIDYPKYKILGAESGKQNGNLKDAWKELKELVASIRPNNHYKCDECELQPYCKWCPARGWLEDRHFTTCDPESRRWAEVRRKEL